MKNSFTGPRECFAMSTTTASICSARLHTKAPIESLSTQPRTMSTWKGICSTGQQQNTGHRLLADKLEGQDNSIADTTVEQADQRSAATMPDSQPLARQIYGKVSTTTPAGDSVPCSGLNEFRVQLEGSGKASSVTGAKPEHLPQQKYLSRPARSDAVRCELEQCYTWESMRSGQHTSKSI